MKKRLVICADGTWNEPNQTDRRQSSRSNVVKIASAIATKGVLPVSQMVYYHPGVGVGGNYLDKFMGGAIGVGISQAIQELYLFLVLNYTPGDELFLFGFSRGAYTVRSLAGFIRNSGILKDKYIEKYKDAYALYRDRTEDSHPKASKSTLFREQFSWPDFSIKFIGVWDTVGALGIPAPFHLGRKQWEFHDVELSSHVGHAYQALAIDEQRKPFSPCVWIKQSSSPVTQVLEQAWFPGVHCNVGGGYYDTGLSDCALEWIMQKAQHCGLEFDKEQKISPNPAGTLRSSVNLGYRLLGVGQRRIGAKLPHSNERLSHAAIQRQALIANYRPLNLLEFMSRNKSLAGFEV